MAVSKLWPVKVNLNAVLDYAANPEKTNINNLSEEQYQALSDVIGYAANGEKTEQQLFVDGINCNPAIARQEFVLVKEQFSKTDGIQAYHGYLSFKEGEVTPEQCQQIGMEFAKRAWGDDYQVFVTTHLNTQHLHCHFVVNSVSFVDGKRLHDNSSWFRFRKIADEVCLQYGVSVVEQPERNHDPDYLTSKEKAGMPTRYSYVRENIDKAILMSRNAYEFQKILQTMGFTCNFSSQRKYWTVTPNGWQKPIRLYRLGEEYTQEKILERIKEHPQLAVKEQRVYFAENKKRYSLPTYGDRIKQRSSGISGRYIYYCFRLGVYPRVRKQNSARLHYLLKEDFAKADRIQTEMKLLTKHHIVTDMQLFDYKAKLETDIEALVQARKNLWKDIKNGCENEPELREQISEINKKLREKRKEIGLCDDIAVRSKVIEKNIETIEKDERQMEAKEI